MAGGEKGGRLSGAGERRFWVLLGESGEVSNISNPDTKRGGAKREERGGICPDAALPQKHRKVQRPRLQRCSKSPWSPSTGGRLLESAVQQELKHQLICCLYAAANIAAALPYPGAHRRWPVNHCSSYTYIYIYFLIHKGK